MDAADVVLPLRSHFAASLPNSDTIDAWAGPVARKSPSYLLSLGLRLPAATLPSKTLGGLFPGRFSYRVEGTDHGAPRVKLTLVPRQRVPD